MFIACFLILTGSHFASANTTHLNLSLHDAEKDALQSSNRLKSTASDEAAAGYHADSQYSSLFPKLSLEGSYGYVSTVPQIAIDHLPPLSLGSNSTYSIGPMLRYTLWDSFSQRRSYEGFSRLAEAKKEDRKNTELQLLLTVRVSYVQVQLALEELRLVHDSLALARAQDHDVSTRYQSGASSRLDHVTAQRPVINYQLQFEQKQSSLALALKDLLALMSDQFNRSVADISHPGPPGVDRVTLALELDSLKDSLAKETHLEFQPPDDTHPQLRGLKLLSESSDLMASSQKAKLLPTLQISAKTSLDYPNGPVPEQIHQNTFMANLSFPLYLGDPSRNLASESQMTAESARFREEQQRIDLQRDFVKTREQMNSLKTQKDLAAQDVAMSEDVARLHYQSYKAGKSNFLDVQTANNLALQAKVNAARVDAQILNQLNLLKSLSGKEL